MAVRNADLGRVDDVGAAERRLEPEVAIADGERRQVAEATARQPVAHGAARCSTGSASPSSANAFEPVTSTRTS